MFGLLTLETIVPFAATRGKRRYAADALTLGGFDAGMETAKVTVLDAAAVSDRARDDTRARGASPTQLDMRASRFTTYTVADHALKESIPDEDAVGESAAVMSAQESASVLGESLRINKEVTLKAMVAAAFTSSGVNTDTPGTKWDANGGVPVTDLRSYLTITARRSGYRPNVCVMQQDVLDEIAGNAEYLDLIKHDGSAMDGSAHARMLAKILDIDEVLTVTGVTNTSASATPTFSGIWGDAVLLAYREPVGINRRTGALISQMTWRAPEGKESIVAYDGAYRVKVVRDEEASSDTLIVGSRYDIKCNWGTDPSAHAAGLAIAPGFYVTNTLSGI